MCLSYRNSSVSHCMIYCQEMQNDALLKTHDLKKLRFLARECRVKKSKLSGEVGSHFGFSFHYCLNVESNKGLHYK